MASKKKFVEVDEKDYSLNDCLLRGRVSAEATDKELPSGEHVVEFRLIITRTEREGVDTLDIAAWSGKSRRTALSLKPGEWVEVAGSIRRRFWQGPAGLASRWQVEGESITRL
jgi:single-strand DNA-binding protein